MSIHVDYVLDISELPESCIRDCSGSGDVSEAVEFWREELKFTVNRNNAIDCLEGYGAWEREDLETDSDEKIANRILWLSCGNFSEFLFWREENPDEPEENASYGSTVYVLE